MYDVFATNAPGYLATTPEEYAQAIGAALDTMSSPDTAAASLHMRRAARLSADRFSDEIFSERIESYFKSFLKIEED